MCSLRLSVRSYAASGNPIVLLRFARLLVVYRRVAFLGRFFLIYINDIVHLFSNSDLSTKLFADDIKIYFELTSEADYSTLQKSINKIFDWSETWQLKLANDKCQHNHISLSTAACHNAYFVSDAKLPLTHSLLRLTS